MMSCSSGTSRTTTAFIVPPVDGALADVDGAGGAAGDGFVADADAAALLFPGWLSVGAGASSARATAMAKPTHAAIHPILSL
jgi:hypothetical protein